ncbi:MAG: type II toxin-antitoxin system HicA family toxin [Candidatus Giovannonibacteria bacterium]|nr:type II toxin-antitoxin system HicA family toxin [Candidatus Giovannonibacteria bacterium]
MPKFYSSDYIIKVLRRKGFVFVSQKGSHMKFQRANPPLTVIIPAGRKEIPIGTFRSILRQSHLKQEDFD